MKKLSVLFVAIAVFAVALSITSTTFAQGPNPASGAGYGRGQGLCGLGTQAGILHDEMVSAFSDVLGIPVDELNTRLANGETISEIAAAQGLTLDEFRTLWKTARTQAVEEALANGEITSEQAEWLKTHGGGQQSGGRGMRGSGMGMHANPNSPFTPVVP
jgi:hypothetical protein